MTEFPAAGSYYEAVNPAPPPRPRLKGFARADVAIIGAGFTGLSAALHLAERGVSVVVLEQARVGWGASGRNGGQLHPGQRLDQDELERLMGLADARRLWRLAEDAKGLLRGLIARHHIHCRYEQGLIHADHKPGFVAHAHAYAAKLREAYDYPHVEALDRERIRELVKSDAYHGGAIDHDGGHLDPLALVQGLADAAEAAGARIFEGFRVRRLIHGRPHRLQDGQGAEVEADTVLVCADGLLEGVEPAVESHVMPIANHIAATAPLGERLSEVLTSRAAVSDSRFVVYYFRPTPDGRLLFGGGETYSTTLPKRIAPIVRGHLLKVFPQLEGVALDHAWGGVLGVTPTRLPFVREVAPGVLTAAGYSGQGVLLGPMFGKILADAVAGRLEGFDLLARLPVPAFPGGTWLRKPILVAAMSYFALRDRL
ncbi:gamma-glutamylputrescine oxidase [Methylopila jiangsuensis]|uniref:Gamma-glutamylputrescine oxidase n=1 Tax=Methylopila jiangsuensis TaxID=586230 RepID=A0A9W6JDS4_9HYPH|nr:FAD-binding oxidoreductase [Methylopila jiangsuensis]MDR6285949.1 gamma-glutamylputrescine oxidase [Methylopila jiangsuensis]GLK75706.1 gamma-glutamylputrescine oxidase [Methylopila jiangsuensis]